jgi:homoserine dehydrogenase
VVLAAISYSLRTADNMREGKIGVAILGLGTVGTGVAEILSQNRAMIFNRSGVDLELKKVLVRDPHKKREIELLPEVYAKNIEEILQDEEIGIVVELMGGLHPAKEYIVKALKAKKAVVTANKAVLANYAPELFQLARENNVPLYYEASVAGGIPLIQPLTESLVGNNINSVMGIINGTTNYILTKMSNEARSFTEVLKEAQELGYAEADPSADVDGLDAAHKLTVLVSLAFDTHIPLSDIYCEGIRTIDTMDIRFARDFGYGIKLLAIGKKTPSGIEARVHPTLIPLNHPLASVNDAFNAVFVNSQEVGELMFYGRGAGRYPTASAVVGDIVSAGRILNGIGTTLSRKFAKGRAVPIAETKGSFYVRLMVEDRPGVLGDIAYILGQNGVSVASVIQEGRAHDQVPLVFVTHEVKQGDLAKSIKNISELACVKEVANVIRVEKGE